MPASPRSALQATVLEASSLTPHMVRLVLGGEDLAGFGAGPFSDHYVKLQVPTGDGAETKTRTYSVRDWDGERLTIDFVVHGDTGVAGRWAAHAAPGDQIALRGPGGAYTPDPSADWHLLAGDACVLPAITVALARIPAGVPVFAVLEVDGPEEEIELTSPGRLHLQWLHRTHAPGEEPELLLDAVSLLALPPGRGQAFVHGEAPSVRHLRRHLLTDRAIAPADLSATGYWKLRRDEEGWRADKADWARQAEADVA